MSAKPISLAQVKLWGARIGAIHWDADRQLGFFEYDPEFLSSKVEIAPLSLPLGKHIYNFPALNPTTFKGLPGLLADCLPDKFGNALIDTWLVQQGRDRNSFNPVERLCYIGSRAMGALEFEPKLDRKQAATQPLHVDSLVLLANQVLSQRQTLSAAFEEQDKSKQEALNQIIQVGTSAGGARAKAVVAWNSQSNEIRSGQVDAPKGFEHWLMKFDGIHNNKDKELTDPQGFGLVEYSYALMAQKAGIEMSDVQLFEENGRSHFMTKRFDRMINAQGQTEKLHMVTLCGLAHFDFNMAGAYSYEQAFDVVQKLGLNKSQQEEFYRRMVFNIVSRNQDDHTKNIAFIMDKTGQWRLSPAYDITFSYNPQGDWTSQHQMSVHGKRDNFTRDDLLSVAKRFNIMKTRANSMIDQCIDACKHWMDIADQQGVNTHFAQHIQNCHRLSL